MKNYKIRNIYKKKKHDEKFKLSTDLKSKTLYRFLFSFVYCFLSVSFYLIERYCETISSLKYILFEYIVYTIYITMKYNMRAKCFLFCLDICNVSVCTFKNVKFVRFLLLFVYYIKLLNLKCTKKDTFYYCSTLIL